MASILKIGERWRAQIRKQGRSIAKTFRTKAEAQSWALDAERNIESPKASGKETVGELIAAYRTAREQSGRPVAPKSNEEYMLRKLKDAFDEDLVRHLNTERIIRFAQDRKVAGAGPYTISMDISKLGTVLRHMSSIKNLGLPDIVKNAWPALNHLKLVGPGGKRERRPSVAELHAIFAWSREHPEYKVPMEDIIRVLQQSAFRRGEIFRITWDDLDEARRLVLVRDRKDPRQKQGNNDWVPLIGDALDIILRQSRDAADGRIFPYQPGTVSKYFKWACDDKKIVDLHLHDLRHEATSMLFEAGWDIPEVAAVTGHKDWRNLKRYTNLDPATVAQKGKLLEFKKKTA
ncbi:site-specific integrase [Cupriavidus plantarum]|uniref:site-specific integrase n=1 Tax=Cupriavidus plantarum TaxID=942865 RepID=UPI000EB0C114|nr:site-specific integrase [Cupriavidus plantarum]RLK45930.1 phage integrase family protein [Cupriavidus plantarum]